MTPSPLCDKRRWLPDTAPMDEHFVWLLDIQTQVIVSGPCCDMVARHYMVELKEDYALWNNPMTGRIRLVEEGKLISNIGWDVGIMALPLSPGYLAVEIPSQDDQHLRIFLAQCVSVNLQSVSYHIVGDQGGICRPVARISLVLGHYFCCWAPYPWSSDPGILHQKFLKFYIAGLRIGFLSVYSCHYSTEGKLLVLLK